MEENALIKYLEADGFYSIKRLATGELAGLMKYMFTTGIVVGLNEYGYRIRFCYPEEEKANEAFASYSGDSFPDDANWVKAKGRNIDSSYVDNLNPKWVSNK